ncbi:MAG: 3-isopropylmalate dehydratase [Deltaproteobacteria bacterium]|nr:3-isopropylmalate dehydratase [Deltaproteobacteria bacterium]MBW2308826.1 3-isopropylmalate dehydratase [Deltaproteobacteria bacterium]
MILKGKARLLPDNVNTDIHCSSKYDKAQRSLEEYADIMFEKISPGFAARIEKGDIIAAGENFGSISSREDAIEIMKKKGVAAILAKSFFRLIYRNAVNLGMPAIVCDTSRIQEGDELELDIDAGVVRDVSQKIEIHFEPFPAVVLELLRDGGIVPQILKQKGRAAG